MYMTCNDLLKFKIADENFLIKRFNLALLNIK